MKISELIDLLGESISKHGDIDVLIEDCGYFADTERWFVSPDGMHETVDWSEVGFLYTGDNALSRDNLSSRNGTALIIGKTFNRP